MGTGRSGDADSRVTAGERPSIAHVDETRPRGHQRSSGSTVEVRPNGQPLDDWLGDISDYDWSENATERAEHQRASPAYQELPSPEGDVGRHRAADPAARAVAAAEAHRAVIERRRLVAGLVVVGVLALAAVIAVLLLRGGGRGRSRLHPRPPARRPCRARPVRRRHLPRRARRQRRRRPRHHGRRFDLRAPRGHEAPARRRRSRARRSAPAGPVERRLRPRSGRRDIRSAYGSGCRRIPGSEWSLRRRSGRP